MASGERLTLELVDVRAEARDIVLLELRRSDGAPLPPFEPGAHLEIKLPNGLIRHYSLTNDWRERDRYVVSVGRVADSRGGSSFVHQALRCGTVLDVAAPRNNFRLEEAAASHLFIAGGIGITPIMAMIHWCEANDRPWRLVYAARSAQRAAFCETLRQFGAKVRFHFDDEQPRLLDVAAVLADVRAGEHVYCCGPQPLMAAVKTQAANLPVASLHFEYFNAPVVDADVATAATTAAGAFRVDLRKSGLSLQVPPDKSILEIVEHAGLKVPFSCREGLCRTCETTVCEGEVEHNDYVLSQDERDAGRSMMICVSRAKSPLLVLDL